MSEHTMAEAINMALSQGLETHPNLVLIGEDVGRAGGVFRVTAGLWERFGSERVLDSPVAESGIVGMAFGMAVAGLHPVAELQFMGFSFPAIDQIISHVSRIRHRSRHRFTAPMVIRIAYGGGVGGAEHHSESMESLYTHIPGLTVVAPSSPYDTKGLLTSALECPDPVIFLEPIRLYRQTRQEVPTEPYRVPIGKPQICREGSDLTLVSHGTTMPEVLQASATLSTRGVSAEVIDLRTLSPLDIGPVLASVKKTSRVAIVHEDPLHNGVGAEVAAQLSDLAFDFLDAPIKRITGWDTVFPLRLTEKFYLPSVERILAELQPILD